MCGSDFLTQDDIEKMLTQGKKVDAALIDLEKAYDRINWMGMWDVLKVYGVGGKLLNGVKAFYKDTNTCMYQGRWRKKMKVLV